VLEAIAATCRCLACDVRLRIIHSLCHEEELAATTLAQRVGVSVELGAHHLRRLMSCSLIQPRRSGRHVYYTLLPTAAPPDRFAPVGLLRRAFRDLRWTTEGWDAKELVHLAPPRAPLPGDDLLRAMDVVFDAATAFAQVRRLQLVRFLTQQPKPTLESLTQPLSMSPQACWRHLDKLFRRGYVRREGRGAWALSPRGRTRFHHALLAEVERSWG
jgi:DNA-binding transcriptional ArsR family regulator